MKEVRERVDTGAKGQLIWQKRRMEKSFSYDNQPWWKHDWMTLVIYYYCIRKLREKSLFKTDSNLSEILTCKAQFNNNSKEFKLVF
jgi:hypothetical protein